MTRKKSYTKGLTAMLADENILIFFFAISSCSSLTLFNLYFSRYLSQTDAFGKTSYF